MSDLVKRQVKRKLKSTNRYDLPAEVSLFDQLSFVFSADFFKINQYIKNIKLSSDIPSQKTS